MTASGNRTSPQDPEEEIQSLRKQVDELDRALDVEISNVGDLVVENHRLHQALSDLNHEAASYVGIGHALSDEDQPLLAAIKRTNIVLAATSDTV